MKQIQFPQTNPSSKLLRSPNIPNITKFVNQEQFLKNVQTSTSEQDTQDNQNYPIIILILCVLILICVCGVIFEVSRRKKLKKDIEQKLLQENLCSIQKNIVKINQIYNQNYLFSTIRFHTKFSLESQNYQQLIMQQQAHHNKLELQITQEKQQDLWSAEGNILIQSNQDIQIHLRTSLDSDLFYKIESIDCIQNKQIIIILNANQIINFQLIWSFIEQENKFQGKWKVYGSQDIEDQSFFGQFELQKESQ